jgi:hypothetical protein
VPELVTFKQIMPFSAFKFYIQKIEAVVIALVRMWRRDSRG